MVLVTTGAILLLGTLLILLIEWNNPYTLGPMDLPAKLLNAFFAVTTRTAGFSGLDVSRMTEEVLFLTMILMYIGGSAGSTAGGMKVNTFAVLTVAVLSAIRGRATATAFGREIPQNQVYRALTVTLLGLTLVLGLAFLLAVTESATFVRVLFEATSAVATVGLSTGITPELSLVGKLLIVAAMYVGRVGPLTLALALAQREKTVRHRYPEGWVKIG